MARVSDAKGAELLRNLKKSLISRNEEREPLPARDCPETVEDELRALAERRRTVPHAPKGHKPKKKKNQKQKKTVLLIKPRNGREREQLLAAQRSVAIRAPAQSSPASSGLQTDFGEAAFKKLQPYRESLDGFVAMHRSPAGISDEDKHFVQERISAGARLEPGTLDAEDGYFIGYDFGTSTTKVVVRYPYGGVDEAFAIEVPTTIRSGGQAHLWPTALWLNRKSGEFSLIPDEEAILLDSFKAALLQGRGNRICNGSGATMEEAAAAFVALHLAYTIGASKEAVDGFKLAAINFGIPVATMGNAHDVSIFKRMMGAAVGLLPRVTPLTLSEVRSALIHPPSPTVPHFPHAELSGVIAGYCAAPRFYVGGHMIIDCGSATLDIASFDLDQRNRPVGIYAAKVENLGADACQSFVDQGVSADECQKGMRFEEHLVFRDTIRRQPSLFTLEEGKFPYQVILVGGGIHCDIHHPFFETLAAAFTRPFHQPSVASTLRYDHSCEAGRLILADGLARDPIDLKDVALPIDLPPRPSGPEMITKDMV